MTGAADLARLRQTLGSSDLAWLIKRLRRRLADGRGESWAGGLGGSIVLRAPTEAQREAVARLFGTRAASGATLVVRVKALDALLRHAGFAGGIEGAVVALTGPVTDQRAARDQEAAQWRDVFAELDAAVVRRPALGVWVSELRTTGLLRRLARGDVVVARDYARGALAVAERLPAPGIALAALSAEAVGDSHALDDGLPIGTLALRLAATLGRERRGGLSPVDAAARRSVWAAVGVFCDELSAPVLVLNLRGHPDTPTGRALAQHAAAGEPYWITTRQLRHTMGACVSVAAGTVVYVCENVTVVEAVANELSVRSAPLVCVNGQPKTSARLLLGQLVDAGARLAYHGDFDWGGIRIANVIMRRHGAVPWRYSSADYLATVGGTPLTGTPVAASWDPALADAMVMAQRAVHEERVVDDLVRDLETAVLR